MNIFPVKLKLTFIYFLLFLRILNYNRAKMSVDQLDNEPSYKVGYATSNQNCWCNGCGKTFTSGTLQIGKIVYKPARYDGKYTDWKHLNCFFQKFPLTCVMIRDPYLIQGFGSLR